MRPETFQKGRSYKFSFRSKSFTVIKIEKGFVTGECEGKKYRRKIYQKGNRELIYLNKGHCFDEMPVSSRLVVN